MMLKMNSIFDTEEDFEFSDDDILNSSLFGKPLDGEKSSPKWENHELHVSKEGISHISVTDSSNVKSNEKNEQIGHDHFKDYSSPSGRLKDIKNCGNFGSNFFQDKIQGRSLNDRNEKTLYKGYKFHSAAERQSQSFLEPVSTIQGSNLLKPARIETENVLSLGPTYYADKQQNGYNRDIESNRADDAIFHVKKQTKQIQENKRFLLDDQPFRESNDIDTNKAEKQSRFTSNLKQQQTKLENNKPNDFPVDKFDRKEVEINQNSMPEAQSTVTLKKRKFPGPAGLLPKLESIQNLNHINTSKNKTSKRRVKTPKMITPTKMVEKEDSDFHRSFWLELQRQALQKYKGLVYHSISMTLKKAYSKQLEKGKVPLMCAIIKTFTLNGSDASIILKDPTGEIHGTIHKGVLESYQSGLCPGSGMILKQVSIFSPSSRKHYVNITPSNIMLLLQEDASVIPSSQSTQNVDSATNSEATERVEHNESSTEVLFEGENQQQDGDIEALFVNDEDFDSWIDDSEDFLSEVSEELPY